MADNIVGLNIGTTGNPILGNLNVDYTTNTVGGGLTLDVLGIPITVGSLALTDNGNGTYTINGITAAGTGVSLGFTGQMPTTITTSVSALGLPIVNSSETVLPTVVCYVSGTLLRTTRGGVDMDIAVEALRIGDLMVTASGARRPVTWLGHRTLDCRRRQDAHALLPIKIAVDAFGVGKPNRDLFVSPGHAICVDMMGEVLIPASSLVNGTTIARVEVDEVTYWHVELESHDILLANGLPAESYIDVGNQAFFVESGMVALDAQPDGAPHSLADYCRPFAAAGPLVEAARDRLAARAVTLGWTPDDALLAGLHLVVDGETIEPAVAGLSARFVLPTDAADVWLVSDTIVPTLQSRTTDGRTLGVCLQAITIDDGLSARSVALTDPRLGTGFHGAEDGGARRWTAGRALLPASLWQGCRDTIFLKVDLITAPFTRWVAPEAAPQRPALRIAHAEAA